MTADHQAPRIRFDSITVAFGPTVVLEDLSFQLAPGEIVGLLGHNGAGKSTLVNVATGAVRNYEGSITLDGVELENGSSPSQASAAGIAVIHQEPALAPNLSVIDNLFLSRKSALESRARREQAAKAALASLGAESIGLDQPVATLALGERQMVDLARAVMAGDVKVLFLDEPTAALGEAETRVLHDIIRRLASQGTSIVYVSHRLPDIVDVCSRIVVLREGQLTLDASTEGFTPRSLSRALAGGSGAVDHDVTATTPGAEVLTVTEPYELSFREGEIVGLFGMAAGAQFSVLQGLYGLSDRPMAYLDGERFRVTSPRHAVRLGVHLVPGDRERDGLVAGMSAIDNVFLPWLHEQQTASRRSRVDMYNQARASLAIMGPDLDAPVGTFSGGNRQKHLLARWIFPKRPRVLLLEQPTQGVDVDAKADIRRCLRELAAQGTTVIVASAETDEIASLCDRAYVISSAAFQEIPSSPEFESDLLKTLFDITPVRTVA